MPNVAFARRSPYIVMAFSDDQSYEQFRDEAASIGIYDVQSHVVDKVPLEDPCAALGLFDVVSDPFGYLIAHMAVSYGCLTYCDVGAHLGITAMDAVLQSLRYGVNPRAFAFDAGQAAQLTWRNFEINGFNIRFEEAAVAGHNGHAIFSTEDGNSVNNRLVNPRDSRSYPVRTLRLDDYLTAQGALGPLAVKIDTQGAEPAVLAGMTGLRHLPLSMLLELTPWSIRESGQDPEIFLADIMRTHHVFDLGPTHERLIEIEDARSLVVAVDTADPYWTDLLAVPRTLVGLDAVLERLRASGSQQVSV